ncbi:MAG: glycosyltransferase family 2 protein [Candidatus Nomurabacteria bacterium]|jgi:glycosyltransferase involved in cell wall biosynthesis|nr:glycosyltransferase family 2 protein [Candidatus Nomurabacteria bacterium]
MKTIDIIIPCHNEAEVFPKLRERLVDLAEKNPAYAWEFIFVNDGSRDKTLEKIKDFAGSDGRVKYLNFSRNFGKETAMLAGLDYADGDAAVIIDADLQDPPELIPEMVKIWGTGVDDVYARRKSRAGESVMKKWTSAVYYNVLQMMTRVPIQADTGDFRLLSRRCVLALRQVRERNRNMKAIFSWVGYKKQEITYDRDKRAAGKTNFNYVKLINLAIDGITSFTTAPLRIATVVGALITLFAFIWIVRVVIRTWLFGPDVAGYPSLMSAILLLGGVQLLSLGVIGEYVGRIFIETKNRPLYFIEESNIKRANEKD